MDAQSVELNETFSVAFARAAVQLHQTSGRRDVPQACENVL